MQVHYPDILTQLTWQVLIEGNSTFVSAPIDFLTSMIYLKLIQNDYRSIGILKVV